MVRKRQAVRTVYHIQNYTCRGHSPLASLDGLTFWASPLAFGLIGYIHTVRRCTYKRPFCFLKLIEQSYKLAKPQPEINIYDPPTPPPSPTGLIAVPTRTLILISFMFSWFKRVELLAYIKENSEGFNSELMR